MCRAHTRAVSRLFKVAMRRLTGQLPASALRRERSHAGKELPQKLVGLHEHLDPAFDDGDTVEGTRHPALYLAQHDRAAGAGDLRP